MAFNRYILLTSFAIMAQSVLGQNFGSLSNTYPAPQQPPQTFSQQPMQPPQPPQAFPQVPLGSHYPAGNGISSFPQQPPQPPQMAFQPPQQPSFTPQFQPAPPVQPQLPPQQPALMPPPAASAPSFGNLASANDASGSTLGLTSPPSNLMNSADSSSFVPAAAVPAAPAAPGGISTPPLATTPTSGSSASVESMSQCLKVCVLAGFYTAKNASITNPCPNQNFAKGFSECLNGENCPEKSTAQWQDVCTKSAPSINSWLANGIPSSTTTTAVPASTATAPASDNMKNTDAIKSSSAYALSASILLLTLVLL